MELEVRRRSLNFEAAVCVSVHPAWCCSSGHTQSVRPFPTTSRGLLPDLCVLCCSVPPHHTHAPWGCMQVGALVSDESEDGAVRSSVAGLANRRSFQQIRANLVKHVSHMRRLCYKSGKPDGMARTVCRPHASTGTTTELT
jgi:hypothetical protein